MFKIYDEWVNIQQWFISVMAAFIKLYYPFKGTIQNEREDADLHSCWELDVEIHPPDKNQVMGLASDNVRPMKQFQQLPLKS